MTAFQPSEVIAGFYDDLNAGAHESAFARFAPDLSYRVVAPPPYGGECDRAALAHKASQVFERLAKPLSLKVQRLVAQEDYVVAEVEGKALTLNGGNYDNSYLFIYRVVDGKIVEGREYLDSAMYVALIEGRL
ncbi:MAG: nuclear transport factor 2 family protein [Rhodobiaceae bacterium]|nr:nuclear transport factor 2 family protein [Novosphingobium sp.]MCC0057614.1 nuclear transport factor 2 family protein [Rhodobiaceae bacterium]